MWSKFFSSKWFERLFTVALAVLTIAITQSWISRKEYNAKLKQDFENRPTTEQVSVKYNDLKIYVDKQDDHMVNALNQHIVESNKTDQYILEMIKSMDGKINVLLSRTNNKPND